MEDDFDAYYSYMMSTSSPVSETKSDINQCIECKGWNLRPDRSNGAIVCIDCGVINCSEMIDESAEWTSGIEDAMSGKDPSRCGCPINPLLEMSSLSTMIGKGGGNKYWLMKKIHQQNSMNYVERSRWHMFENITSMCEKGNLPVVVINYAKQYYKTVSEKRLTRGGVRQGLVACCILYACKQCNVSRTVKEISQITGIESTKINSASKIFESLMKEHLEEPKENTHRDLILRFCSYLGIDDCKQQCMISQKVDSLSEEITKSRILVGKTPSAITSGLIYTVLCDMGYKVNKKNMASNHGISIVTLNKIKAIIDDYRLKKS